MLKLRKGDTAIMIKADGSIEMAGVQDKELVNDKGQISPCILFAAAWAKKDEKLILHLVKNFQNCVREGYFGADAQEDFKKLEVEWEKQRIQKEKEEAVKKIEEKYGKGTPVPPSPEEAAAKLNQAGIKPDEKDKIAETLGLEYSETKKEETEPEEKKSVEVDPRLKPLPMQMPDGKTVMVEPTETPEETAKRLKEEAYLEAIAKKGQDPRVKRQQDALKKGAKKIKKGEYTGHKQPDLPVDQTMKYLKATPEEQKKMLEEEKKKKQIIGTATIEEKKDNEN